MKRRDFMSWFGLGLMATSLPMVIAACQSSDESSESAASPEAEERPELESTPREDGFTPVGYVSDLDEKGFVAGKEIGAAGVAVIRDPADAEGVVAVTSMCPHQGCHVEWDKEASVFACPCHGSKFASDGALEDGPAEKPLDAIEAKIDGDIVLVKV